VAALEEAPFTGPAGPIPWDRRQLDLDDPGDVGRRLDADQAEVVVHAAAWTDVDGCARDPQLAFQRNGLATGVLATACVDRGIDLLVVSTNEVFDGRRTDRRGYAPDDPPNPINAYGASKLAGESAAREAYAREVASAGRLGIVRTAWLFGPPGNDFPAKILAAADGARASGAPLRVVGDEIGSPTYAPDLAEAIVELIGSGDSSGVHHIVNSGPASRAEWARELLRQAAIDLPIEEIPAAAWPRASTPPAWAVLEPTPLPSGEALRPWTEALADYLPLLLRGRMAAPRR
jgi:dTDP-4-dehydrorhamnose reductase